MSQKPYFAEIKKGSTYSSIFKNSTSISGPLCLLLVLVVLLISSCRENNDGKIIWSSSFEGLGTFSSIKAIDLNQDGVKDIVLGAGANEFKASELGVLALNGKDGSLLWSSPCKDQMFGSAVFSDINQDGIHDVIIAGRGAQMKALNGKDGTPIWEFMIKDNDHSSKGYMRFNFFNPQVLPDVNKDGVDDFLVSNGGNIAAFKRTGEDRYPGVLGVLNGVDGSILAVDTMPDGQETYMSPLVIPNNNIDSIEIIYGSGGERFGGSLYKTNLSSLLRNNISQSMVLATRENRGFIAPPCLIDINNDNIKDIVVNAHRGECLAIDGKSHTVIWTQYLPNTELNSSPCPGDVNKDGTPDFFSSFSIGRWPKNTGTIQLLLDGKNGDILFQDTMGCAGFATALSYDLDRDGSQEFIFNTNQYNCTGIYLADSSYELLAYNHAAQSIDTLIKSQAGKNISTTPLIGDLNKDGTAELIYCRQANYSDIGSYFGIQVGGMSLDLPFNNQGNCLEYMCPQN